MEDGMTTKALYDIDAYQTDFTAQVCACEKVTGSESNKYRVRLDATAFFPEQGGQSSDIGHIANTVVTDVQISDGIIWHYCDSPLEVGEKVTGRIDWEHRFNNMQQHTGEHIFTGIAHSRYGAENVGFHLSDNTVMLDLDLELDESQIKEIELASNQLIARDVRVKAYYPSKEELQRTDYRSKKEIEGQVRLVEIEDTDICACCAPHVSSTGQVGILKVISYGKYKGGTRVYILCGLRALIDYNRRMDILSESYRLLNCREEELPEKITSLMEDNRQRGYELSEIKSRMLLEKIAAYPTELFDVTVFTEDVDSKNMRDAVNMLVEKHAGLCSVFSGDDEAGYDFVIGSKTRDCKAIAAGLRELLGAKGGGSKEMAQGHVCATRSAIEETL